MVATPKTYQIFETVCESQVQMRLLSYMLSENGDSYFFFNQVEIFMLSQYKHVKLVDVTKNNFKLSHF